MHHPCLGLVLLLTLFFSIPLPAQKVLQIERYGKARTQKFYIGDQITYQVEGQDVWLTRTIEDLIIDRDLLMFEDRYVAREDIAAFRYQRPWTRAASISLYTFGLAWSGFALVGTLTDGNPDTNYRASDAIVTGVSVGLGFLVSQVLSKNTVTFGKRRRLRMLDLRFKDF